MNPTVTVSFKKFPFVRCFFTASHEHRIQVSRGTRLFDLIRVVERHLFDLVKLSQMFEDLDLVDRRDECCVRTRKDGWRMKYGWRDGEYFVSFDFDVVTRAVVPLVQRPRYMDVGSDDDADRAAGDDRVADVTNRLSCLLHAKPAGDRRHKCVQRYSVYKIRVVDGAFDISRTVTFRESYRGVDERTTSLRCTKITATGEHVVELTYCDGIMEVLNGLLADKSHPSNLVL